MGEESCQKTTTRETTTGKKRTTRILASEEWKIDNDPFIDFTSDATVLHGLSLFCWVSEIDGCQVPQAG